MSNWDSISVRSGTKATLEALQDEDESIDAVIQRLAAAYEDSETPTDGDLTLPEDVLREAHIDDISAQTAQRVVDLFETRFR